MHFLDTETKIFTALENTIQVLGFELVLVSIINEGGKTLKIIIRDSYGWK